MTQTQKRYIGQSIGSSCAPGKAVYELTWYEKLFILMGSTMPLEPYNFSMMGLGLSIDRLLLGLLIIGLPFYKRHRNVQFGIPQILGMLGILSTILSLITGAGFDQHARDVVPSMLQGYMLLIVGSGLLINNPKTIKIFTIIALAWSFIFLLFSIHMLYYYYFEVSTVVPFPFKGYYSDIDLHKLKMMRSRRLFMPFASAPFLGGSAGFVAIFAFCNYLYTRRASALIITLMLAMISILTLSRGPLLSMLACFVLLVGLGTMIKALRIDSRIYMFIFIISLMFLGLKGYGSFQKEKGGKITSERLTIDLEDIRTGRHLELRLYAIELFMQGEVTEVIGGQGFGAFMKSQIGAYSFASYLTLLVETGLIGVLIFTVTILYPMQLSWSAYNFTKRRNLWYFMTFCMSAYIGFLHFFYEFKSLGILWFDLALIYGLSYSEPHVLNIAGNWARTVRLPERNKGRSHLVPKALGDS